VGNEDTTRREGRDLYLNGPGKISSQPGGCDKFCFQCAKSVIMGKSDEIISLNFQHYYRRFNMGLVHGVSAPGGPNIARWIADRKYLFNFSDICIRSLFNLNPVR